MVFYNITFKKPTDLKSTQEIHHIHIHIASQSKAKYYKLVFIFPSESVTCMRRRPCGVKATAAQKVALIWL